MSKKLKLSPLPKTWIFDLDGTMVKHNGYKLDGEDTLLEGVIQFFQKINEEDMVIILTARSSDYKNETLAFLNKNNIRYNHIIFNAPHGERILINDKKPSGLDTAHSINLERDHFVPVSFKVDENL